MKQFILKIKTFVTNLFKTVEEQAKVIIPIGIKVVNSIKMFVDSNTADVLTAIIPGDIDDNAKLILRAIIPKILKEMEQWQDIISLPENEQLKAIITTINSYPKVKRDAIKLSIASQVNAALMGGKLSLSDAVIATQYVYSYETNKAA